MPPIPNQQIWIITQKHDGIRVGFSEYKHNLFLYTYRIQLMFNSNDSNGQCTKHFYIHHYRQWIVAWLQLTQLTTWPKYRIPFNWISILGNCKYIESIVYCLSHSPALQHENVNLIAGSHRIFNGLWFGTGTNRNYIVNDERTLCGHCSCRMYILYSVYDTQRYQRTKMLCWLYSCY